MILDASAIVAVIMAEPRSDEVIQKMKGAAVLAVGAPTLLEAALVLSSRLRRDARPLLGEFLRGSDLEVIPFTRDHYEVAVDAFERYGKGSHAAALNFGDCLAYAVARVAGMPLLFVGDDFAKTDISKG
jgi:ribonuclease VapC